MIHKNLTSATVAGLIGVGLVFSATTGQVGRASQDTVPLTHVPMDLPPAADDGLIYLTTPDGARRATTIDPALQTHLTNFLVDSKSPIAAVVVADAKTGSILAMAQGRAPGEWGGKGHTALHTGFPAASLFKTVVTAAAFEVADIHGSDPLGLNGGCSHVRETGDWLKEKPISDVSRMSLRRAFGSSCNGFFAKIAVNHLGLGPILDFARRFGWETGVPVDFQMDKSPFLPPSAEASSTHTIGRFSAGFGYVGLSTVHAAWMMLAIANKGAPLPLRLFRDSPQTSAAQMTERIFSPETAARLSEIMDSTVRGGTASYAFRSGKFRKLRELVGGKTGTLTGSSPKGLTTWFAGVAPTYDPEVVVASVVMLDDRWHIKGPSLAAEGLWAYFDGKTKSAAQAVSNLVPAAQLDNAKSSQ